MSQAEANEVMELWAERQRQESARQSLITVHDVAEATQLSTQDVERLLQEVRSARPATSNAPRPTPKPVLAQNASGEPTLRDAYIRLAPVSGVVAFFFAIYLQHFSYYTFSSGGVFGLRDLARVMWIYTLVIAIVFIPKWFRKRLDAMAMKRLQDVEHYGR